MEISETRPQFRKLHFRKMKKQQRTFCLGRKCKTGISLLKSYQMKQAVGNRYHPAGDVTRVSVMPRKDTVKIGDAENRCRGCRDKNR